MSELVKCVSVSFSAATFPCLSLWENTECWLILYRSTWHVSTLEHPLFIFFLSPLRKFVRGEFLKENRSAKKGEKDQIRSSTFLLTEAIQKNNEQYAVKKRNATTIIVDKGCHLIRCDVCGCVCLQDFKGRREPTLDVLQ